jgi:glycosyltransferase involved in cell wall biosynthesis
LVTGLADRGLNVALVVVEGEMPVEVPGVSTICLGARRGLRGPLSLVRASVRLRRYLRQTRPRVVHSALARGYVVAATAVARGAGPRIVSWRRNEGVHLQGRGRWATAVERWAARRADVLLANSEAVLTYWQSVVGGSVDIRVVPNAIDDRFFANAEVAATTSPGPAILISVGALKPVKAHETIVAACGLLRGRGMDVEVVLVGDGPRRGVLVAQSQALGVPLRITGVVDDVLPWLRGATVYVHSSTSEGVSNAIMEAMAAGLPLVVPEIAGMEDVVGETAVRYPVGSVVELADAIGALLDKPDVRQALGQAARARMSTWRAASVIDQYVAIYGVEDLCAA